jgi:hypothetical protein
MQLRCSVENSSENRGNHVKNRLKTRCLFDPTLTDFVSSEFRAKLSEGLGNLDEVSRRLELVEA